MENVFIDYAICAVPLQIGNFSANFGIFFGYLNAGVIDRIDNTGTVLSGGFTPYDIILGASFAKKIFGNLGVGGTVKGIYSDIAGISSASCAFDAGFTYGLLQDSLKVGASVQNLGFPMKFSSQQDSLPLTIRVGASYKLKSLLVSLDSVIPNDGNLTLHFGAEYGIKIMYGIDGLLRIGYNGKNALTGGLAGFSLGGGIQGNVYTIDYAWVPYGIVGSTHRLSMGLKF